MIYLDTNVLLSLFAVDELTERAMDWYSKQTEPIAMSEWGRAEFCGVIGLRKRKAELSAAQAKSAIAALDIQAARHFVMLPVVNEAATFAATWLRDPDCSLQTGDALHLAIAGNGRASTIATFDERFVKAAARLRLPNIKVALITDPPHKAEQKRATYRINVPQTTKKVGANSRKTDSLKTVQEKLAQLGLTEQDIADAVASARKKKKKPAAPAPKNRVVVP